MYKVLKYLFEDEIQVLCGVSRLKWDGVGGRCKMAVGKQVRQEVGRDVRGDGVGVGVGMVYVQVDAA